MKVRLFSGAMVLAAAVTLIASAPADMHLRLVKAEPAVDGTVTAAPKEIRLFFSEAPEIRATRVIITNGAKTEIAVAAVHADEKDGKIVITPVTGAIEPGAYTVTWRTMAKDGHPVNGEFKFTMRAAD
jgi:methionine-rich copper-binding protein CopC